MRTSVGGSCRAIVVALCLGLAGTALAPVARAADVRRLEAVGVVPLKSHQRGSAGALDEAIQAALREAVSRVARGFLMEAEPDGEEDVDVEQVLGQRMVPYTSRFRILDDQGERPAMFADDPGVDREYVVVVEVHVDADRVEQRLIEAGLLQRSPAAGGGTRVALEVRGLREYAAYEALRRLLTEELGARSALPRGFEPGVAILEVELADARSDATDLAEWLVGQDAPGLRVRPVEVDRTRLVVSVEWTAPAGEPAPVSTWR